MTTPVRALILHESPETAARLVEELTRGGFQPAFEQVTSGEALDRALSTGAWDIVLSDYRVGGFGALQALALLKKRKITFWIKEFTLTNALEAALVQIGDVESLDAVKVWRRSPARWISMLLVHGKVEK